MAKLLGRSGVEPREWGIPARGKCKYDGVFLDRKILIFSRGFSGRKPQKLLYLKAFHCFAEADV